MSTCNSYVQPEVVEGPIMPLCLWRVEATGTFVVMLCAFNILPLFEIPLALMRADKLVAEVYFWYIFMGPLCFFLLIGVFMMGACKYGFLSGGHFNPAVTITFALFLRFPWKLVPWYVCGQVPWYICGQLLGALVASGVYRLISFLMWNDHFIGTVPSGSNVQSFVMEFGISFLMMFVICAIAPEYTVDGEEAGVAVGMIVLLNYAVARRISGASMNPARTLGPAIVFGRYQGLWIYLVGPILGCVSGALAHHIMKYIEKSIKKSVSLKNIAHGSNVV